MQIRTQVNGFKNKILQTAHALIFPEYDLVIPKHKNILALLETPNGRLLIPASNIVTNDGDLFYAELMAGQVPTETFTTHELGSAGTPGKTAIRSDFTPIASTEKLEAATYPKTNDGDADNTGAGTDIRTTLASYAKGDFASAGITHGWVTNPTPGASEPLLTGYAFAATFEKTVNDTLKVFVNHEALGI